VKNKRPALFRGRHFQDEIIVLCLRWYLRYSLSYRDLEEMRKPNRSWRVDETYVRVAGRWAYLYRAVDSEGNTIDFMLSPNRDLTAAKHFLLEF
jgi:IS6 family transposase